MKKFALFLCCMAMVFALVGGANAIPTTLIDTTTFNNSGTTPFEDYNAHGWGSVNKLDGIFDFLSWTHHYTFNPPAGELLDARLCLTLKDDNDRILPEFAFGWGEDGSWDIGEVDTGTYGYKIETAYLGDGAYSIKLASLGGDFYIEKSELKIKYNAVPEPVMVIFLGTGLVGLLAASRKRLLR